jgi:hypothetical protein
MGSERAAVVATYFLMFGVIALGVGLWWSNSRIDGVPTITCDGEVMSPGDRCVSVSTGVGDSYEELLQGKYESDEQAAAVGPVVTAVGGTVSVASVLVLVVLAGRTAKRRREDDHSTDAAWWSEGAR